ncbi:unnamed protein product [Rhizophagus irregularis]|nr:unnamed protein product [Rhizophagus irregularis]
MSDVVKDFNTEELIDYLGRKNLKLDKDDIKILRKEKIAGSDFLKLTKEDFRSIGFTLGPTTRLTEFIESLSQKLRNYSSLKTLDDLKEMLHRNKVNGEDITSIKQFTPVFEEINNDDKALNHCMEDIILKLSNVETMTDANEATRCEFISSILHASIAIAKKLTSQDIFIVLQKDISGEDAGRVDYAIKSLEDLLCITEGKPCNIKIGIWRNLKRITELEAENAELRKENTEIRDLRIKLSISDAEIAELKRMRTEVLRANGEHNERRDAENAKLKATIEELKSENAKFRDRLAKVEQKQTLNDNTPNNNSSNFNLVAVPGAITVPTEEKEIDNFLLEAHKKIVSSEIKRRNKEKKLHAESVASSEQEVVKQSCQNSHKKKGVEKIAQVIIDGILDDVKHREPISSGCSLREPFHETEISATARRPKCSSSLLDLAKLFDKASDAEYRTKKANEEEILCWVNFGKEFMVHFSELVENSNGKIGEKKAKGIIYDEMLEQLVTIREKRSKEMGIQLPKISRCFLTRRTQRSMKLVRIIEKIDDSDDDGYGGYNEYGERDRGYYCRDGGYERNTSLMMSPIISPVTA